MGTIWRGYDRAGLDAQYNIRNLISNFQDYFNRWAEASARARQTLPNTLDIAYGSAKGERLDFFPGAGPNAPIVVYIHGGYWQSLDKSDWSYLATGLQPRGWAMAVINYDLTPTVTLAELVRQCRAAIAFLWREGRRLGADPDRLHICGNSAGGHLTALLALTDWPGFASDLPANLVKSGCAVSGLYELEPIRLCYLNDKIGLDAAAARQLSPLTMALDPSHRLPNTTLLLATGGIETPEFHCQQDVLRAALAGRGHPPGVVGLPGMNHFDAIDTFADPSGDLVTAFGHLIDRT